MHGNRLATIAALALLVPGTALAGPCEDKAAWAAAAQPEIEQAFTLMKAQDKPGFAAQFGEVGKACKACHDAYRKPDDHH